LVPKDRGARQVARDIEYGRLKRQRLDIYAPKPASQEPRPVVVFFYGGAWSDGAREHYGFAARALAALGHVVVVPDYRLVPEVEYPDFLADCAAAVGFVGEVIGRYGGDARRLVLAGHSAGAYNAAMLALDGRWLPEAVRRSIVGVIGLSGPYDFFPFDGPISRRVFGAAPEPLSTQPINHVGVQSPPMLLVSGGRDDLVLPRNSGHLAAALEAHGVPATLRIYPKLGHAETLLALSLPLRWMAPVLVECGSFLDRVTNPATQEALI
jgi:acetyl esterase/lipase